MAPDSVPFVSAFGEPPGGVVQTVRLSPRACLSISVQTFCSSSIIERAPGFCLSSAIHFGSSPRRVNAVDRFFWVSGCHFGFISLRGIRRAQYSFKAGVRLLKGI